MKTYNFMAKNHSILISIVAENEEEALEGIDDYFCGGGVAGLILIDHDENEILL